MKKLILSLFVVIIFCGIDTVPTEPYPYRPIMMTREVLESSVELIEPAKLIKPGKIYIKDDYLFINEKYKGLHIIDNTDPSNPVNKGFLRIPGSIDMAMKGNILYVDNAVDLVAIDLSDPSNIIVTRRIKNVFPEIVPPGEFDIPWMYSIDQRPENTVIIGWEKI